MTSLSRTGTNPSQLSSSAVIAIAAATIAAALLFGIGYGLGLVALTVVLLLIPAAMLMIANPDRATLVFLFVLYSNIAVVAVRFHRVNPVIGGSFALLLAIPLFRILVIERKGLVINKGLLMLLVYFLVQFASAVFSDDPGLSADRLISYLIEGLVLYFLVLNTVRSKEALRKALWVIVLAGAFVGMFSWYQRITSNYSQNFGGLAQVERVEMETSDGATVQRVAGTIGEKNYYGEMMLVLLPLGLMRLWSERSRSLRWTALAASLVITGAVLLTYSRGAGLCMVFIVGCLVYLRYLSFRRVMALGLIAAVLMLVAAPGFVDRMTTLVTGGTAVTQVRAVDPALRGRLTENLAALNLFLSSPVLGIGSGQAPIRIPQVGNQEGFKRLEGVRPAHNLYLEEMASTGIIGFSVLMLILLTTVRDLYRTRLHLAAVSPRDAALVAGLLIALLGFLFNSIFLSLAYMRYFFLLLAFCGVAIRLYDPQDPEAFSAHESQLV